MVKTALCPWCGKAAVITGENPCRPFCSERCRTLDLGGWLTERYKVSEPASETDEGEHTARSDDDEPPDSGAAKQS